MAKIIVVAWAPGSGKTTISNLLKEKLNNCPLIDFWWIREFHLDKNWSNVSEMEEQMSFENLLFILNNYIKYNYEYVIINDLNPNRIKEITQSFHKDNFLIFSLVVTNPDELTWRVLNEERDSWYRNYIESNRLNDVLLKRELLTNEFKVDNTHNSPEKTVESIIDIINNHWY